MIMMDDVAQMFTHKIETYYTTVLESDPNKYLDPTLPMLTL